MFSTEKYSDFCADKRHKAVRWINKGKVKTLELSGFESNTSPEDDLIDFVIPVDFLDKSTRNVLIVDDEPAMGSAMKRVLEREGIRTCLVENGLDTGIQMIKSRPDLLTVDLGLPDINGQDLIRAIRQDAEFAKTKILVVSAKDDAELEQAKVNGADACLQKPFTNQELLSSINALL